MLPQELMWSTRPILCKLSYSPLIKVPDFSNGAHYLKLSEIDYENLVLTQRQRIKKVHRWTIEQDLKQKE